MKSLLKKVLCFALILISVLAIYEPAVGESLARSKYTIAVGQTQNIQVAGYNSTTQIVSSNPNIFTVDNQGNLKGINKGSATLSVINGGVTRAKATVKVVDPGKSVVGMKLNYTEKTVLIKKSFKLKVKLNPSRPTDKSIKWYSSNSAVASVTSQGTVKGKKEGEAIITATSSSGIFAVCKVTVKPVEVTKVKVSKSKGSLKIGGSAKLTAKVYPSNATYKTITWSSSNSNVATVSSSGKVKAIAPGTAVIYAKAVNGKAATCTVTVKPVYVTSIKLSNSSGKLDYGQTYTLKAYLSPSNATNKQVTWSSSNTLVATVDQNGTITAKTKGIAYITAKTTDGSNKSASCKVTVLSSPDNRNAATIDMTNIRTMINSIPLVPQSSGYEPLDNAIDALFKKLFTDNMTTFDKVVVAYEYLTKNYTYQREIVFSQVPNGYTHVGQAKALYLLMYQRGSCNCHTGAMKFILERIGIPCDVIYGKVRYKDGTMGGHYWASITVRGVDFIFDSQVEKNDMSNGKVTFKRFCKKYSEMDGRYVPKEKNPKTW